MLPSEQTSVSIRWTASTLGVIERIEQFPARPVAATKLVLTMCLEVGARSVVDRGGRGFGDRHEPVSVITMNRVSVIAMDRTPQYLALSGSASPMTPPPATEATLARHHRSDGPPAQLALLRTSGWILYH